MVTFSESLSLGAISMLCLLLCFIALCACLDQAGRLGIREAVNATQVIVSCSNALCFNSAEILLYPSVHLKMEREIEKCIIYVSQS